MCDIKQTQDINQGQKLEEPNFSCAIQMLVFPMNAVFVHHKTIPTVGQLSRTRRILNTFFFI